MVNFASSFLALSIASTAFARALPQPNIQVSVTDSQIHARDAYASVDEVVVKRAPTVKTVLSFGSDGPKLAKEEAEVRKLPHGATCVFSVQSAVQNNGVPGKDGQAAEKALGGPNCHGLSAVVATATKQAKLCLLYSNDIKASIDDGNPVLAPARTVMFAGLVCT